ncbi:hypothetical protein ERO13_A02G037100v2 [Gossypium hirsutum]|uniref:Uncharacterized protein n=6 Tax=Gossypium TaxID=3633 RepID=A0ABR0QPF4_GOSAR|nr:uncharacterized protein At4g14450, chloroplastic-like [Gossypium hirsutum]XP_017633237.1 uncharacterized protein At4g14450, chloroplastic-like [Gossypium arboreum]KAB2092611.1 hypothetical protein ES319_A02G041400v1 [Gossypium barbadense]TYH27134.1 hypothetical protein ES288_A02G045100v1 [Gossypium darwinii]TYI38680.1 hypothetical protein ES332_A02G045100v1 [Gossypium tomentosum]TYJ45262.1 hypothetical protein E1A91_A02G043400v1 [Gossypium mustelinum]KAG4210296.1 hypothetical protein ERO13
MSTTPRKSSAVDGSDQRQPSRLQRCAPASIRISPVSNWNVAIPLLSPVPPSPPSIVLGMTEKREELPRKEQQRQNQTTERQKRVFAMWQHPAAPFCYEPAPFVPV